MLIAQSPPVIEAAGAASTGIDWSFLTNNAEQILVLALMCIGAVVIFGAKRSRWGDTLSTFGIALMGVVLAGGGAAWLTWGDTIRTAIFH